MINETITIKLPIEGLLIVLEELVIANLNKDPVHAEIINNPNLRFSPAKRYPLVKIENKGNISNKPYMPYLCVDLVKDYIIIKNLLRSSFDVRDYFKTNPVLEKISNQKSNVIDGYVPDIDIYNIDEIDTKSFLEKHNIVKHEEEILKLLESIFSIILNIPSLELKDKVLSFDTEGVNFIINIHEHVFIYRYMELLKHLNYNVKNDNHYVTNDNDVDNYINELSKLDIEIRTVSDRYQTKDIFSNWR